MLFSADKKENDLIVVRNQALEHSIRTNYPSSLASTTITAERVISDAEKYLKFLRSA